MDKESEDENDEEDLSGKTISRSVLLQLELSYNMSLFSRVPSLPLPSARPSPPSLLHPFVACSPPCAVSCGILCPPPLYPPPPQNHRLCKLSEDGRSRPASLELMQIYAKDKDKDKEGGDLTGKEI